MRQILHLQNLIFKLPEYAKAWKSMMDQVDNTSGSFGLNAVAYGNRYANHMVYIGVIQ